MSTDIEILNKVFNQHDPIMIDLSAITLNEKKKIQDLANGADLIEVFQASENKDALVQGLIWIFGMKRDPGFTYEMAGEALPIHYGWVMKDDGQGGRAFPLEGLTFGMSEAMAKNSSGTGNTLTDSKEIQSLQKNGDIGEA